MLKIDDLITEEPTFTFENITYHFDFSLKAMLKFQKWSQNQANETNLDNHVEDLLKILIQEFDQFWLKFKNLSFNNQTKIVNTLVKIWVQEMIPDNQIFSKEAQKK